MITKMSHNVWQLSFDTFGSCVYIVRTPEIIIIDTSSKEAREELLENLKKLGIEPVTVKTIVLTHNHYDHIGNIECFPHATIYDIKNITAFQKKFHEFKVYKTPGHTKDSICLLYHDVLFSGDTIFDKNHNYIGRTDLPESIPDQMDKSLETLRHLNYDVLCPGHKV